MTKQYESPTPSVDPAAAAFLQSLANTNLLADYGYFTETVIMGVVGAALVGVSIGLWRLHAWNWRRAMIVVGIVLVFNLWSYFRGNHTVITTVALLVDILVVFYLIQPEVRRLFIDQPKDDLPHLT